MKINGQYPKPTSTDRNVQGAGQKDTAHKAGKAGETPVSTKTVTSDLTLNKVKAKIENTPDIDLERVKALKDRIKKGEYKVDAKKLAGNLLKDSAIEDLRKKT